MDHASLEHGVVKLPPLDDTNQGRREPVATLIRYLGDWHDWYWAAVPLLTIVAYITVLRIGFLADDFSQLYEGRKTGVDPLSFLSYPFGFVRPVGGLLIYQLGWVLWGYNPLPYHMVGLLTHAASALILGLWGAAVSRNRSLGWLAGTLFGVFPLHVEAVGWVVAQFDTFATLFGLASLWCFTLWWGSYAPRKWPLYALSLLLYTLGVFTKESLLTFLPIFAISAWLVAAPKERREWLRLAFALVVLLLPIALNVTIRLIKWGSLGGYAGVRTDYANFIWGNFSAYARILLAPLNKAVFGNAWVESIALLSLVALLVGVALYSRKRWRMMLLAAVWLGVTLVPVLNLALLSDDLQRNMLPMLNVPVNSDNLQQNRYLYLVSAGYLVGVAALLHTAIASARRWRTLLITLVVSLVLLLMGACWVQLRPWHTATVQVNELVDELLQVIPARSRPNGMAWYVEKLPFKYSGVPLLLSGLGISRVFRNGEIDYPQVQRVPDAAQAPIDTDKRDAFAIRFGYDEALARFKLDYLSGITGEDSPPGASEGGANLLLWDFRDCAPEIVSSWQPINAQASCERGKGLALQPRNADPQILGPAIDAKVTSSGGRFMRLRVSARYQPGDGEGQAVQQWFWKGSNTEFGGERYKTLPINRDGVTHVYWTFIPITEVGQDVTMLRFDPANSMTQVEIGWIAMDVAK